MTSQATDTTRRPPRTKRTSLFTFKRVILVLLLLLGGLVAAAALVPTTRWAVANGYVMTDSEVELRSTVEGNIVQWLVPSGTQVSAGQIVLQLDDSLQLASLEQARADVSTRQAQLQRMITQFEFEDAQIAEQISRLEQRLTSASARLAKLEATVAGVFSEEEYVTARLEVAILSSQLAELRLPREAVRAEQLAVVREQIASAEKAVALHEAQVNLRKIRAPIDGTVYFNRFAPGELIRSDDVLGHVFDRGRWVVKLKLSERQIAHVDLDQPVEVSLAPYPTLRYGYLSARVSRILPVVTPQATGDGIFYIEALLEPRDGLQLEPGMSASASIDTGPTTWLFRILGW